MGGRTMGRVMRTAVMAALCVVGLSAGAWAGEAGFIWWEGEDYSETSLIVHFYTPVNFNLLDCCDVNWMPPIR